jgi:hypothetical protein
MRLAEGYTDFRPFSALELNIRAESGTVDPAIVLVDRTWGSSVRVANYVEAGIIDEQWRRAVIPVPALVSDEFALDTVYLIAFRPSPTGPLPSSIAAPARPRFKKPIVICCPR